MILEIVAASALFYVMSCPIIIGAFCLISDFGMGCDTLSCRILRLLIRVYSFNTIKLNPNVLYQEK